jgi:Tol biopolymer transport system component
VFNSGRTGVLDLYQMLTNGAGVEERLVAGDQVMSPNSWSSDGRFLINTELPADAAPITLIQHWNPEAR